MNALLLASLLALPGIAAPKTKATSPKARPAIPAEAEKQMYMAAIYQKEATDATGLGLALKAYEKAIELAPSWPEAHFNYSVALESAKRYEDAERELQLYLSYKPADAAEAKKRLYALEAKKNLAAAAAAVPTFAGRWASEATRSFPNGLYTFSKDGDGWKALDSDLTPLNIVKSETRLIEIEDSLGLGWATRHTTFVLSEDASRIDVTYYDTQSPAQFAAMEAKSPGSRLTDLETRHRYVLTRK